MMSDIEEKSEPNSILILVASTPPVAAEKSTIDMTTEDSEKQLGVFRAMTNFLLRWGIETHG